VTNRELLEAAARAAGYNVEYDEIDDRWHIEDRPGAHPDTWPRWKPLADDGDALRLAVILGINLEIGGAGIGDVQAGKRDHWACEWLDRADPYAATRRAIVRAAAEIGKRIDTPQEAG
jgi:hypothetical protein